MTSLHADIAIMGAGFAGSLMALILRRLGRSVVLLERDRHPRFALGEASTPFANLLLADLARRYELPRLLPLAKYGPWKRAYPRLTTGLKRGFSFFQHHASEEFRPSASHAEELLVAASTSNETSDTHWYRPEFDQFIAQEAEAADIPYFDQTQLEVAQREPHWILRGKRLSEAIEVTCSFVIDASGPGGFLAHALNIDTRPTTMKTNSWSVYSHFVGVGRWEDILRQLGGHTSDYPYPCDDSTLHQLLDGGWMWVIPFENGITSAGFLLDETKRPRDETQSAEEEWRAIMRHYPSIASQFADAKPVQPWFCSGRLQRRATQFCGPDWVMLPHAAYALDALFSIGNGHTLLGIERLARTIERYWGQATLIDALRSDESKLRREIEFVDALVHACYRSFGRARLFHATCMFYFAGVHAAELARAEGRSLPTDRFLSSHHESLAVAVSEASQRIDQSTSEAEIEEYEAWVRRQIAPLNRGGFCDGAKQNLYPCE